MPYSTCVRRVLLVAEHLKLSIELVPVDILTGAQKTPEFLKLQPFGQIPALIDTDGTVIYESRAICRYLSFKHNAVNPDFYPVSNMKQFGLVEQWCSVEASNFDPSISGITFESFFKPVFFKQETNQVALDAHVEKAKSILAVYEAHLAVNKYLVGDSITIADVFHIPYAFYTIKKTPIGESLVAEFPFVSKWLNGLFESAAMILS